MTILLKSFYFYGRCFVRPPAGKQISARRNHFSLLAQNSRNAAWLSSPQQERRAAPGAATGDGQMRILSFVLTFAFVLAGPSMAGLSDDTLPGVGTFAYSGSPIVTSAPQRIMVAVR
jgi:hypothetical protein